VGNGENLAAGGRFHRAERMAVLADVLARNPWPARLWTPAVARTIAAPEARLVLEQQAHSAGKMLRL